MFQGRSVLLILCLNFLVLVVFHYLLIYNGSSKIDLGQHQKPAHIYSGWCLFPVIIVYPVMGWLADTRYGRYKMIKIGVWVMWVASILSSLLAIAKFEFHTKHTNVPSFVPGILDVALFILISLGLSFFHANIIQFGIDQLVDASSVNMRAYVNWYTWTFFASEIIVDASRACAKGKFHLASTLVPPVFLSMALLLILFFSNYLIVEPVTHNPLKLIFEVMRYASKNKYPRSRSAFTYWDDKPYSRIDLAKHKYGGPFSIEEVENVKAFFRILAPISIMSAFVGLGYIYMDLLPHTVDFGDSKNGTNTVLCLKSHAILNLGSLLVVLVIPVYEIFVFPLCSNCFLNLTSRRKFSAGIACWVLNVVTHLIIFASNRKGDPLPHRLCSDRKSGNSLYYYVLIPKALECFGKILLFGSSLEFVCAQAPYSMKGLLFGTMFALSGVFLVLAYIGLLPFRVQMSGIHWDNVPMGCGFWFFVAYLILCLVLAVCFLAVVRTYKNRQRSEDLPSEHFFAEDYYDRSDPEAEPMVDAST